MHDASTTTTTKMDSSASSSSYPPTVGIPLSRSRKKLKPSTRSPKPPPPPQTKWRTSAQEGIYGRRLLEALLSARSNNNTNDTSSQPDDRATLPLSPPPPAPRAIKEAADSALALTAKGQSRWSRAILSRRWHMRKLILKAGGKIRRGKKGSAAKAAAMVTKRWKKCEGKQQMGVLKGKKVRDRLRLLARLVPGCRKVSTPSLLEETADYVAALELQVKAMRALADALSSASAAASSSSSSDAAAVTRPPPPPPPQS